MSDDAGRVWLPIDSAPVGAFIWVRDDSGHRHFVWNDLDVMIGDADGEPSGLMVEWSPLTRIAEFQRAMLFNAKGAHAHGR